ncbi:fasciclin domain-containing protein [Balneolales bacterium ANBcel1]|nr:fasciclin domain-containing protein [Balneolales bacterium ANBcel1]
MTRITAFRNLMIIGVSVVLVSGIGTQARAQMETGENIVESIGQFGQIQYFHTLLEDTGLVEKLEGDESYTVLAPTNQAFQEVPSEVMEELVGDVDKMRELIRAHIFPGAVQAGDLAGLDELTSVQGAEYEVVHGEQGISVGGVMMVAADIIATNGVVHATDAVILP